jgi:hypothetical protein
MSTLGAVRSVIECLPSGTPLAGLPCPAGTGPVAIDAYVIESASAGYIDGIAEPFDLTGASAFFFAAFIFTLTIYIGASFYGTIIDFARRIF